MHIFMYVCMWNVCMYLIMYIFKCAIILCLVAHHLFIGIFMDDQRKYAEEYIFIYNSIFMCYVTQDITRDVIRIFANAEGVV